MKKIILILCNVLFSQVLTDISFIGTKSVGLAGAVVSNPTEVESVFYNPAGLYNLKLNGKKAFLVGQTQLYKLDFLEHQYLCIGFPRGFVFSYQNLGTSHKGSKLLDLNRFSEHGFHEFNGHLSKERSYTLSHGFALLNDKNSTISMGYNINYFLMYQNRSAGPSGTGQDGLPKGEINSMGFDLGIFASLRNKISFGAFVKNLNNPKLSKGSSSIHLPRRLDLGITYNPFEELITTFALNHVLGNHKSSFRFGIEYKLSDAFLLRTGIQINPNRYGAGFSYKFKKVEVSYSLLTHSVLSITDVFNLKVKFD